MHDHCSVCGCRDVRVFRSLVTIPSMGVRDIGSDCGCLMVDLSQFAQPKPPEPVNETVALKMVMGGLR